MSAALYILFGVFVLWILHKHLGLSIQSVFKTLMSEFRSLMKLDYNRGSLNALLLILLLTLALIHFFIDPFRHMIEIAQTANHRSDNSSPFEFIAIFFGIALTGLFCVRSV